ncbi:MAG TPA: hypothetical protein VHC69_07355 [Polyangiaceae bacterium]|nr:hypothetical protein [Polyangiaceae bacterium]
MSAKHGQQGINDGLHSPFTWTFADSTARSSFTPTSGTPTTSGALTSSDVDKIALQLSDSTVWLLSSIGPATWTQIVGGSSFTAAGDLSGSSSSQTVIGLQSHAVASTSPTDGYALVWSQSNNRWQPGAILDGAIFTIDGYTTTNSTPGTVKTIALSDNTFYRITFEYLARDNTTNFYKKKSSTDWYRASGANATQLGIEDGPSPVDNITCTGATILGSGTNVIIQFGGHASNHTSGYLMCYVYSHGLAAAL